MPFVALAFVVLVRTVSSEGAGIPGASTPAGQDEFQAQLDRVLSDPAFEGAQVGVEAVRCDDGAVVYAREPDLLLNPASNLKLLTSAVALDVLGPAYTFRTSVLVDGPFEDGVVRGNLYLRGEGDPKLVFEGVWKLVKDLQARGLRQVEGDLVADDTFFDRERLIPDWDRADRDDEAFPYDATIGALSVNFNTVALYVRPGDQVGDPVRVTMETPTDYVQVECHATTGGSRTRPVLQFLRGPSSAGRETLTLSGSLPLGVSGFRFHRTVRDPVRFALAVFSELMAREGIEVKGRTRQGRVPAGAEELVHRDSEPLGILLRYMNKLSSNFIAEQVLKTLGAEVLGAPGTTEKGLRVVREFLAREELPWESSVLFNGSGLSEHTRVSPHQLTSLLCHVWQDPRIRSDFVASLPIAGVDGTMRRRMQGTPAAGLLRAKTGSVRGVFGFSGYLWTGTGEAIAFAFLVNDFRNGVRSIKEAQDRWANVMVSGEVGEPPTTGMAKKE